MTEGLRARRAGAALTAALTLVVVACSGPKPAPAQRFRFERLLEAAQEELDEAGLYRDVELRRVVFGPGAGTAGWSMGDGSALPEPSPLGLALPAERATERLVGPVGESPDRIVAVEVELEQPTPSGVALFWPRVDGRFYADQAIGRQPDARGVARFEVASHPRWGGPGARIAIQPSFAPQAVRLRSVRFLSLRIDGDRARALPAEPRRVSLEGDSRTALAVTLGRPSSLTARVPPGALLRFALGLPTHAGSAAVELRLSEAGSSAHKEISYRVERHDTRPGWNEHELDLAAYAGRQLSLSLRVEPGSADASPVVYWGNPMLRIPEAGAAPPSVLLVSADTLRADHLSLYGYRRTTSPNLDRWARKRGTVFLSTVAPSPWTLPSHVSMLTGVDAHRHGVSRQGPIPAELPLLAELFSAAGYQTLASTAGGLVQARFGFARGFDVFRSREKPSARTSRNELEFGVDEVLSWIESHAGEPTFVFFHTYATHTPLRPHEPHFSRLRGPGPLPERPLDVVPVSPREEDGFRRRYRFVWTSPLPDGGGPEASPAAPAPPGLDLNDPQLGLDLYDSSIAWLDEGLGRVLDKLESLGLAERTVVVFTSDHGESFGDNGLYAHTHLQDSNLMVPLVVSPRQGGGRRTVEGQVRVVDVAPTLLEMAKLEVPAGLDGRSLLSLANGRSTAHPEEAWSYASGTNWGLSLRLANRWKLIVPNTIWPALRGKDELYDLSADRVETRNLAGSPAHARLRGLAARELDTIRKGVVVGVRCSTPPCYQVVIGGLGADHVSVTSPDVTCSCIAPVPTGTRLTPGPGNAFTITYEDVVDGEMAVALESKGPGSASRSLKRRVGPGQAPFALRLESGAWHLDEGEASVPANGLVVSYAGSITRPRPEVVREAEERLRALGYIQ